MLTLDQTLEALALALPRIGGALDPYALPLALVYDAEIYPLAVAVVCRARTFTPATAEALKCFALALPRDGRCSLLVRTLAEMRDDAHGILVAYGARPQLAPDGTGKPSLWWDAEPMTEEQRSIVLRTWDARGESPVWTALRDALVQMFTAAAANGGKFYINGQIELTGCKCDLKATNGYHARMCPQRGEGK